MKANTASRTAQYMAFFRALENARTEDKRLFTDNYATLFLDAGLKLAAKVSTWPLAGGFIYWLANNRGPGALSSGIARTRYIDDLLHREIEKGIKQLIIPGAGFDTRAMRLPFLKQIPVIEIDHPDTSDFKKQKLVAAFGQLPANTQLYKIDFNTQSLDELAKANGFNFSIPTTIIWEGVTNYLEQESVNKTFAFLSKFTAGSSVIFTYIDKKVMDNPDAFYGTANTIKTLRNKQEQWKLGFVPEQMEGYLEGYNFKLLEDRSALEYRRQYMPERGNLLKGYEFYHVALAVCK